MIHAKYDNSLPKEWCLAHFDKVFKRIERKIMIDDASLYNCVGVRWYGMGAFIREREQGINIARKQQWIIKAGDVVYNKLFAWKGAFAIADSTVDNCIVSDKFPTYEANLDLIDPRYLGYYFRTAGIAQQAQVLSKGGAAISKLTLNPPQFWDLALPLPPLEEQRRIVVRIEELAGKIKEARELGTEITSDTCKLLLGEYKRITRDAKPLPMKKVAPLVRRPVQVELSGDYHELGIRSFGKGTFHKPPITGTAVGTKKLFRIEENDLLFNNVFAWEGAVAVAKPEDDGRVGSHRFLTCVPRQGIATAPFLCFHFLTDEGLQQLMRASPGSAGRNRTLGIQALENILVPVPSFEEQLQFDRLQAKLNQVKKLHSETSMELDTLFPSLLDKAFKGEL